MNQYNYQQEMLQNRHPEYYKDLIERKPYEFQSGDTKPIAFYLPQFYSFPENDEWWGKGFTEWTNVTKAMPQFEGHYQPHLAGELGYYNLMTDGIMERQIELSKMYGIYGFCFHFYMFDNRKRLLEKPLNKFLDNPDLDMPFCLCFANENWTRRWDGLENDVLMAQTYSNTFEIDLAEEMLVYLQDKRYIKIDGKPLVIIYRIDILPSPTEFSNRFRGECHKLGIGEIYLCSVLSFGIGNAINYGFDDNIEFPLHGINNLSVTEKVNIFDENFNGKVFSYPNVVKSELNKDIDFPRFRGIMPSWDNEARKPNEGHIIHGSTPELYKIWLQNLCYKTINERPESKRFVFINAWNEWAEGSHLEPDRRYGYAYLEATYQAVTNQKNEVNTYAFDFENLDSQEVNKIDFGLATKRIKYFIQLFIENENGFSEESSIKFPILENNEIQKFEFDLKNNKNIKSLRLDPLNDSCVIEIEKLYLLQKDGKEIDLISLISSNVSSIQDKNYFFETFDPQIYVENLGLEVLKFSDKLYVELKYNHISKDAVHMCVSQITTDKDYKIAILEKEKVVLQESLSNMVEKASSLEKEKVVLQESLSNMEEKASNLENELIAIYISKSWKITRPLRNIIRKIRNLKKR
ncbi:glycoside hydrolase family 99-like domain-containing protein [Arcobacter sp. s6]|uniref:glycoside hydrolase family 99-like domain-containing protein n=1 Tax=Arcobacter sp. s6 TaxID=3230363 RepID=UPI0034A09A6F